MSRGSPWKQEEIETVKNGFPRRSVNNLCCFGAALLNAVNVHRLGFPRAGSKGSMGSFSLSSKEK